MNLFDILVESRMREWQSRPANEKERRREGHDERVSYEAQVVDEIEQLILRANEPGNEQRSKLLRKADDRTTELFKILERRGNNLTARLVGEKIASLRRADKDQS